DESAGSVTTRKEATFSNFVEKFQLEFYRVEVHFFFSEKEKEAIYERFNSAKQLLINIISTDPRCTQIWSNIIDGAYEKITPLSSTSQIVQQLFTSSITTRPMLQELIAKKIIIAFVHPNTVASPSILDPVRTKEYATTTKFEDKALITINPMVFNYNTTIHGSHITGESCTLFLAILLAHEITHAVKYIGETITTTPELPFFRTYSCPDEYDGGNTLEHELIAGEIHINRDSAQTNAELFIIGSNGQHCHISQSDINNCIKNNSVQPLSSLGHRLELKRKRATDTIDSKRTCTDYSQATDYENENNNEKFIPLLHYHTRRSVFQETNVDENEHYQSLLKYHHEEDASYVQSPDNPVLLLI
ncbi:unnamed protein product, partial [Didymodactylos carnosus]